MTGASDRYILLMETEITEPAIIRLVDGFYASVRQDSQLAPVFTQAIAEAEWPAHLDTMYRFWSSVMLTSGRYKGNPMAVHLGVAGIEPSLFQHWLALFEAKAQELFVPALAAAFIAKARRIAESLKLALFFDPARPSPGH
jgi:hemoglobin